MLQSVIQHVKLNANAVATKVIGRAIVAVPFVIAAAFAVAALAAWLINVVGAPAAYAILAAGFALLGVVVAAFVILQERQQEAILRQSEATRAAMVSSLTASPLALVASMQGLTKGLGRRVPMAVLLMVAAGLLLRRSATSADHPPPPGNSAEHPNSDARVH